MKFSEVMIFYDYKMTNVAKAARVSRNTVKTWYKKNAIPFDKQCYLQVVSEGKLIAEKE